MECPEPSIPYAVALCSECPERSIPRPKLRADGRGPAPNVDPLKPPSVDPLRPPTVEARSPPPCLGVPGTTMLGIAVWRRRRRECWRRFLRLLSPPAPPTLPVLLILPELLILPRVLILPAVLILSAVLILAALLYLLLIVLVRAPPTVLGDM